MVVLVKLCCSHLKNLKNGRDLDSPNFSHVNHHDPRHFITAHDKNLLVMFSPRYLSWGTVTMQFVHGKHPLSTCCMTISEVVLTIEQKRRLEQWLQQVTLSWHFRWKFQGGQNLQRTGTLQRFVLQPRKKHGSEHLFPKVSKVSGLPTSSRLQWKQWYLPEVAWLMPAAHGGNGSHDSLSTGWKTGGIFPHSSCRYIYQLLRSPFPKNILGNGLKKTVQRCFPSKRRSFVKKSHQFRHSFIRWWLHPTRPNSHLVMKGCHGIDAKAPPVLVGEVVSLCWLVNSSFNPFEKICFTPEI